MYGLCDKIVRLPKPVKVSDNSIGTNLLEICPFSIHYESMIFIVQDIEHFIAKEIIIF
jgi:hypothetical protein